MPKFESKNNSIDNQPDKQTKGLIVDAGATAIAAAGSFLVIDNFHNTKAALTFLGSDGQASRGSYVKARNIQNELVEARSEQPHDGKPAFIHLVNGIAQDPNLQGKVVTLTNEPLSDNAWLTPNQNVASPLGGITGIMLATAGLTTLVTHRLTSRSKKRTHKNALISSVEGEE